MAAKALRFEAWTTPKPGLVDMNNSGIHKDMDLTTLMSSISVIVPYFRRFFLIGVESARKNPEQSFALLRAEGLKAEAELLSKWPCKYTTDLCQNFNIILVIPLHDRSGIIYHHASVIR